MKRKDVFFASFVKDSRWAWVHFVVAIFCNMLLRLCFYAFDLLNPDIREELGISVQMFSILNSVKMFVNYNTMLVAPLIWKTLDYRATLVVSALIISICLFTAAFVKNFLWLFVSMGIFAPGASIVAEMVVVFMLSQSFKKRLNVALSAFVISFAIGSPISSYIYSILLRDMTWRQVVILMSGIGLNMIVMACFIRTSCKTKDVCCDKKQPNEKTADILSSTASAFQSIQTIAACQSESAKSNDGILKMYQQVASLKTVWFFYISRFFGSFSSNSSLFLFPLFLEEKFGLSSSKVSYYMTLGTLGQVLAAVSYTHLTLPTIYSV